MEKSINLKLSLCASVSSVRKSSSSFLQSSMWGEFKSRFGWKAHFFNLEINGKSCSLLVLVKKIAKVFSFAYIPWGPEIECSAEDLCELSNELKLFLPKNNVFIRYDLPWTKKGDDHAASLRLCVIKKIKKSEVDIQAPDTVIIDLTKSCEEILANMKPKSRYNINLATKKGVKINVQCTMANAQLEYFYNLLKETAVRDKIAIHSFEYYKTLFELCQKDSDFDIRLYMASHEEDLLAGIIVLFYGKTATYLYGASANKKRNLMAPYALQWQAMQDAKEKGCEKYDLFGIPPNEDPNHPMAGLYRFKTGFGGNIIHRLGCWDYAYKRFIYRLFSFAEKIRKKYIVR